MNLEMNNEIPLRCNDKGYIDIVRNPSVHCFQFNLHCSDMIHSLTNHFNGLGDFQLESIILFLQELHTLLCRTATTSTHFHFI